MERDRLRCCRYLAGGAAPPAVGQSLLGGAPRFAPERAFDTLHVRLELDVDLARRSASGLCSTRLKALRGPLRELEFSAAGMRVLSARGPEGGLKFRHEGERLTLRLPKPLAAGQETVVEVRYRLDRPEAGLHFLARDPENRGPAIQAWTQGQPEDSHRWFPCHDAPHAKATTEVHAAVPKGFTAVSNGRLLGRETRGGKETFHWRMDRPHSLYLVSLAVGRFSELKDRWRDVDILYYCEKGREEDARRGFAKTPKAMAFFSDYLGVPYPYGKYAQVAAARFPGGMENTTCTTQTDAVLIPREAALDTDLDLLVAHELAHHWFGDLVTCRDWSHAWLNEGFATYLEYLFTEHDKGRDEADREWDINRRSYFDEDARRYRRPVVCGTFRNPWILFDRHLYEKGGWVLHMLRRRLGEEDWRRALKHYLGKHRDKSVETADLAVAVEEATGRNIRPFLDQWVHRPGYPVFDVRYHFEKGRAELLVRQTQGEPLFKARVLLRFTGPGGRWTREFTETIDKKEHKLSYRLPGEPALAEFDPGHDLLKKLEFHKPYRLWANELKSARSGVSRSHAAWHVARWGSREAVRALERAVRSDPFWGAAADAARALGTIPTEPARRALEGLARVRHPKVRRAVAQALGGYHVPSAARILDRLLRSDPSVHVRGEAARSLGRLRDPKWLTSLKGGLKVRSYWDVVACGALQGLTELRDARVLGLLRRTAEGGAYPARAVALRALERFAIFDDRVTGWIRKALKSADSRVVLTAVSTLGGLEDRRALKDLEGLRRHADVRVRTAAEEAVARIRREAVPEQDRRKQTGPRRSPG